MVEISAAFASADSVLTTAVANIVSEHNTELQAEIDTRSTETASLQGSCTALEATYTNTQVSALVTAETDLRVVADGLLDW